MTIGTDPFRVIPRWNDGNTALLHKGEWYLHHVMSKPEFDSQVAKILVIAEGPEIEEPNPDIVHGWLRADAAAYGDILKEFSEEATKQDLELDEGYYVITDCGDGDVNIRWEGDWASDCDGCWSVRSATMEEIDGVLTIVKKYDHTRIRVEFEGTP